MYASADWEDSDSITPPFINWPKGLDFSFRIGKLHSRQSSYPKVNTPGGRAQLTHLDSSEGSVPPNSNFEWGMIRDCSEMGRHMCSA